MVTLDSIIGDRRVAGMKIDVEGAEHPALLGCADALRERRVRLLQLEWNSAADRHPVAELLSRFGYRLLQATRNGDLVDVRPKDCSSDLFAEPI